MLKELEALLNLSRINLFVGWLIPTAMQNTGLVMPIITGHGNVPSWIDTLYAVAKLNPAIVLSGHGKATTGKSVIRDADLLAAVWKLVKEGYEEGKLQDEILLQVSDMLGPKYRPLYKDFDSAIKHQVKLMHKQQQ